MPEISDETKVTVPLRNLVGLGASLVVATAAYVTLNSRITTLEHGQSIQDMTMKENAAFVREWPLGLRGALPDDLIQNAKIMALEEQKKEVRELRTKINDLEIKTGQCSDGVR